MPLPLSNSVSAKAIRSIVVLKIISRFLVGEIFKTMYLVDGDFELRRELWLIAQDNPPKDAFTCVLLISLRDQGCLDNHIDLAVQQSYKQAKELLEPSLAEKFRADLQSSSSRQLIFGVTCKPGKAITKSTWSFQLSNLGRGRR